MATLEKIRGKAGLLVVVLGIALLAFIVGDLFNIGSAFGRDAQEKMIVVNGETVSHAQFQQEVDLFTAMREKYSGQKLNGDEETYQIRQYIFESLVNSELISKESEKIGLTVSDEELSDLIFGKVPSPVISSYPAFMNPQTQTFDKNALMEFYHYSENDSFPQVKAEWRFLKIMIKDQQLQNKYTNLVAKTLTPNSLDAKFAFESAKVSADFAYVRQNYTSIPDSTIEVTAKEIKALYNERKNRFKQPEDARGIRYITLNINPSEEDYAAGEKDLADVKDTLQKASTIEAIADVVNMIPGNKFVDAFVAEAGLTPKLKAFADSAHVGTVVGPYLDGSAYKMLKMVAKTTASDTIHFYQLGFPLTESPEMRTLLDSITNEVKGGKTMDEIAQSFGSSSPLQSMTELQLVSQFGIEFKDACFNLSLNQVSEIKSTGALHLVTVTRKSAPVAKVKIAEIDNQVYAGNVTTNKYYNDANQFITYNTTLEKFEAGAKEKGYMLSPITYVRPNDLTVGNTKRTRDVVRWAFNNDPGSVKFFEAEDQIIMAIIESKVKKGYASEAMVENELKREILNDKKAEQIIAKIKSASANSLEDYAKALVASVDTTRFVNFGMGSISGIGMEPKLEALAPVMDENKISEPIKGNNGVYLIKVYNKTTSSAEFDAKMEKEKLQRNSRFMNYLQVLKDKAKIEDNRSFFY